MKTRIRRSKEKAREIIVDAAEYQLRTDGPDAFRLVDVAHRAGMHQSNLFHHFGSREALLRAVASRAFERAAREANDALAKARFASPEDRVQALADVFDAVQQEGTELYAWLILSGRMGEANAPDFRPLVETMRNWRGAMFSAALDGQSEDELRQLLMLSAIVWLGESVVGRISGQVLELGEEPETRRRFHRLLAWMIVTWLEVQEERLRKQATPMEQAAS